MSEPPDPLAKPIAAIIEALAVPMRRTPGKIPYFMTTDDGRQMFLTDDIAGPMHTVADLLWAADAAVRARHTHAEWWKSVQRAFAAALLDEHLNAERTAAVAAIGAAVKAYLTEHANGHAAREFAFACTLLPESDRTLPVLTQATFERRDAWLARKVSDGDISAVTARRVLAAWAERKPRRRKSSTDATHERAILRAVGKAHFICTVRTHSLAAEAAEQRALMAARLALLTVALLWSRPGGALSGLNLAFDGLRQSRETMVFVESHLLGGWREEKDPHAPWSTHQEWESALTAFSDILAAADEAIGFVLSQPGASSRPNVLQALSQAMLWYHDACREPLAMMAIVSCGVALDALAGGQRGNAIKDLICARRGLTPDETYWGSRTVAQVVNVIYHKARNDGAHGVKAPFDEDLSRTRALAEGVTRDMLLACLRWAHANPDVDDVDQLRRRQRDIGVLAGNRPSVPHST